MIRSIYSTSAIVLILIFLSACSGSKSEPEKITESVMIDKISRSAGLTRSQAQIGLSALMILSEYKLSPEEFTKLTGDLPGGDNLFKLASDLGFDSGSVTTSAGIIQILVNLGANPVDAGRFLSSVLGFSKEIEGGVFGLLSKVYED
ncbi:MAG TPA: DUF2780 domain-containing protein [Ignavibacteria bacterium]|nr:DUF2780 domain-containing protein [Ignavibacteria bacterium]HMR39244.1 DUF2780 domain-containing protein [Ignavibacteria bacterium]